MSAIRLGRLPDGSRHVIVQEPAYARKVGHGGISVGFLGGTVITVESERSRQLRMQRDAMRKARAK